MKKGLFLCITLLFAATLVGTAQKKGKHTYEKIKTLKINFISSELNLSPEVAEKFWPIYNEYEKANHQLRSSSLKKIKEEVKNNGSIEELTDEQAIELSNKFLAITDQYAENKRTTFKELEEVLSPKQLLQLHFAEIEFNYKVLRKLNKEKRENEQ